MPQLIDSSDEAREFYERVRLHYYRSDWSAAAEAFAQSAALDPHFKTLELLGECFLKLGRVFPRLQPARQALREVREEVRRYARIPGLRRFAPSSWGFVRP